VCCDGISGLLMAMKNNYDVIICDIGLPDMDGFDIVKKLRSETLLSIPTLIALSGYNQFGIQQRAKESGFDYYLVKPVNTAVLLDIISSITLYRK
jgi:CheY-like chemotaxis protein